MSGRGADLAKARRAACCVLAFLPLVHADSCPAISPSYPIRLAAADDAKPRLGDLPSNLVAPHTFEPVLSKMWKESPTFRRQCARIGAERGLLIRIYPNASITGFSGRAATQFRGKGPAIVNADVYLSVGSDPVELVGHELEHVIEHLDGLDLPRLARLAPTTVWPTGDGAFETLRAIHVGRVVAAEVGGRAHSRVP